MPPTLPSRLLGTSAFALATALTLAAAPLQAATPGAATFRPEAFGALPDGKTDDTQALQKAIDAAAAAGGGIVALSEGTYLSGPLELKSGVDLYLPAETVLKAAPSTLLTGDQAFRPAFIGAPSTHGEALIRASGVHDIAITGSGRIDGSGAEWWPAAREVRAKLKAGDTDWFAKTYPKIPPANGMPRPWLVEFSHVSNARIGAVQITDAPMWTVVLRDSRKITVDGTKIASPADAPNTDGIDVVSSAEVTLRHLDISTGDDDIAIKSGLATTPGAPSRDILIEDSIIRAGHGVSIGSETAHGISDVDMRALHFIGTTNGIRIKSARDRGSDIGHIRVNRVRMKDVAIPLTITDLYAGQTAQSGAPEAIAAAPRSATTPSVHDISVHGLTAKGARDAGLLQGLPEAPLRNVYLMDVTISAQHSGLKMAYAQAHLVHVRIDADGGKSLSVGPDTHIEGTVTPVEEASAKRPE